YVQNRKRNICCSLHSAAVLRSDTVEPAHTSGTSCCSAEFSAVSAAFSQFIRLSAKNFTDESACSHSTGICLADCYDLSDLIRRNTGSDCAVSSQCGGRSNHRINSVI